MLSVYACADRAVDLANAEVAPQVAAGGTWPTQVMEFALRNPSAVVGLVGLAVTVLFFWLGSRRNRMEATFEALELFQDKDSRNARFNLQTLLTKAAEAPEGFRALSPEERATISSIALQFGFVGTLLRQRRVFGSIIFASFASSIVLNHYRLRSYAEWRKTVRPLSDGSLWASFDWLEVRARRYICIRSEPSRLRRTLTRLRVLRPREHALDALKQEAEQTWEAAVQEPAPKPRAVRRKARADAPVQASEGAEAPGNRRTG